MLADYGASHGTAASLNNGLDFEPWPGVAYGPAPVNAAIAAGQATDAQVDEHVRRILRTAFQFGFFDRAAYADDDSQIDQRRPRRDRARHRDVGHHAAAQREPRAAARRRQAGQDRA